MSGIAGIVNLDGRPVESTWLETMAERLAHRGPDQSGVWRRGHAGLCHLGLWTTPEASLEALPAELANGIIITGDIRLDNREELLGLLPKSTPDSSLVVAAYQKWGESCVEHLLGDFAFAIWDVAGQKLFCARDQMGVKPFYYAWLPNRRFAFASEIKGVLAVPGVSDAINEKRIADAFVHVFNDPASTYYTEVMRLPAAHCLTVTSEVATRRYWRLNPDRELRLKSDQEYAERFYGLFSQAVRCRMRTSPPVGAMLSGGLDSSSVSCVARNWLKEQGQPPLHTFSAVFDEVTECDERPYIREVIAQGHCEPTYLALDRVSPLRDAEAMISHLDEPISAGNLYLNWNSYRKAQQLGVRVILDGYDGDTTVSHGNGRLLELAAAGRWYDLAVEVRGVSKSFHEKRWLNAWWHWVLKYHPLGKRAHRLWSGAGRRVSYRRKPAPSAWSPVDLLNPDLVRRLELQSAAPATAPRGRTEREQHFNLLQREIMTKGMELLSHTSAAFNVEVRFPFMDVRLIEFCLSLPSEQKMRRGYSRLVLRHGMAGVLPEKIRWRPGKSNLGPSFDKGLFKFEQNNLRKIIHGQAGRMAAYLDLKRLEEPLARFQRGAADEMDSIAVWTAADLALWLSNREAAGEPVDAATRVSNYK